MWQAVLGFDLPLWLKFIIVFPLVLLLIWAFVYGLKRFGGGALGRSITPRGRQPRLAVIETTSIDGRRQLWLIRRDNVEHLIMTGGPTDLVVEPSIVRAASAAPAREAAPGRVTPTLADTLPRTVPVADAGNWPLQPDVPPMRAEPPLRPEPPVRAEPPMRGELPMRAEAPMRPQRAAAPLPPAPPPPAPIDEDVEAHEPDWSARDEPAIESEPPPRVEPRAEPALRAEPPLRAEPMLRAVPDPEPPERPQRAARGQNSERNSERLAGLAADLSRTFMDPDLSAPRRPAGERRPPPPPVQPVPSGPPLSEAEEQNLTEMAQRLESALQRPRQNPIAAAESTPPAPPAPPALRAVELPRIEPIARAEAKPPRPEIVPAPPAATSPVVKPAAKPAASPMTRPTTAKPALATLEQEMASLLGRSSSGKT